MKKFFTLLVFLISMSLFSQKDIINEPFAAYMTQEDMPVGKSFIVIPLDGSPAFAGISDAITVSYMPINTPFVLKVTGRESKRFKLSNRKPGDN
jgi:hypothetical protein